MQQATSECLSGLDVQGRSFPQQIRPLPERAKIKLVALLSRSPVMNKLLRPLDFDCLDPRLARSLRLVEKLLRPEQRMQDDTTQNTNTLVQYEA
jgi:3-methyladenine DNA glycosylase AlkC